MLKHIQVFIKVNLVLFLLSWINLDKPVNLEKPVSI